MVNIEKNITELEEIQRLIFSVEFAKDWKDPKQPIYIYLQRIDILECLSENAAGYLAELARRGQPLKGDFNVANLKIVSALMAVTNFILVSRSEERLSCWMEASLIPLEPVTAEELLTAITIPLPIEVSTPSPFFNPFTISVAKDRAMGVA